MDWFEHTRKSGQTEDLVPEFVRYVPGYHATVGIADHSERLVPQIILDVLQSPLCDLVCAGRVHVCVSFSPREIKVNALPAGTIDDVLQREHDSMIYPESVDGDEGEAFS
jgi:hypothetical protein